MAASVAEQIIAEVWTNPDLAAVISDRHDVGERCIYNHTAPMAVVAVPRGAPVIRPPDRHGDPKSTSVGRILLLRDFKIDWYCHGASDDVNADGQFGAAENVFIKTIIALRQLLHNSVQFENEEWLDQNPESDGYERFGSVIKFTSVVTLPIYEPRAAAPLATVTSVQTTVNLPPTGSDKLTETINQ